MTYAKLTAAVAALSLFTVLVGQQAGAESLSDLINGKKITVTIKCDYGKNMAGPLTLQMNAKGHVVYKHPSCHDMELTDGKGGDDYRAISTQVDGNKITVVDRIVHWKGASITTTINLRGNSCSAVYEGENGEASFEEMDPSCRIASCVVAAVASGAQKTSRPSAPNCTDPAPGTVKRHSPSFACVIAKNTNTDPRCVYSFTYKLSGKGSQPGGNVAAGTSEERCTQQAGVEISFEKWTKSGGSAR